MTDFCGCDGHGSCGEYNSSRFPESEILYHKKWDGLYDSHIREFRRNVTICYCDTGWTGYSDLGTFHIEVLQNCAIKKAVTTVLWAIVLVSSVIQCFCMIQRELKQREKGKGIRSKLRMFVRLVPTITFIGVAGAKLTSVNEPWFVTIGVSPGMTVAYLSGVLCFMFDIIETQHRQLHRYYSKIFKDFGFGNRVNIEQTHLVLSLKMQQVCVSLTTIVLGAAVIYGSKSTCFVAEVVQVIVLLLIFLVDVLIVDPKTNARFLVILNQMIDANDVGSQLQDKEQHAGFQDQNGGPVRMNSVSVKVNARLQEVHTKIAMMNKNKRVQTLLYVLSYVPFCNLKWWRYMAYNIAFTIVLHSTARTFASLLSWRRTQRREQFTKLQLNKKVDSSEVSAFQSTVVSVAPLVTKTQVIVDQHSEQDLVK